MKRPSPRGHSTWLPAPSRHFRPQGVEMITVMARLRVANWDQFRTVHDEPRLQQRRREAGCLTHHVLAQLDDSTDVIYLDTWSTPQDSDDFYHVDTFYDELQELQAELMEIVKL